MKKPLVIKNEIGFYSRGFKNYINICNFCNHSIKSIDFIGVSAVTDFKKLPVTYL